MKYTKIINAEVWNSLSGIAEYTTDLIWNDKENLLPSEYNISKDEIKSETYSEMGYLINNYKEGSRSLQTYIFEYLKKRVISNIFDEYKKVHLSNLEYIDAGFNNESDEEKHQYGKYDFPDRKDIREHIEDNDILKTKYKEANKLDKMIMELIFSGYSYDEIAKDLGLNKMDITRRMRKYSKKER